jgi:hypothetical protein
MKDYTKLFLILYFLIASLYSNAQNVGISDASGQTPGALLDIKATGAADNGIIINQSNAGNFNPFIKWQLSGTTLFTLGVDESDASKFKLGTTAVGTSTIFTVSGTNMGVGTIAPGYRFDVANSGAGILTVGRFQNTVAAANNSGAQLLFAANRTTGGLTDIAGVAGMITDITNGAYKGALTFYTANNAAPAERMRIDNTGTVQFNAYTTNGIVRTTGGNGTLSSTGGAINLTSEVTGTLPVGNGGTGTATGPTAGGIIYGSSGTAYGSTGAGTSGYVLTSGGAGVPTWTDPASLGVRWNAITNPNGNLSLTHGTNTTTMSSAVTSGTFWTHTGTAITTGKLFDIATSGNTWTGNSTTSGLVNISSTSTAGTASGSDILLYLSRSGANANTAHAAYGIYSTVTNTNATSGTNIGGYFSAGGATTANYGLRGINTSAISGSAGIHGNGVANADGYLGYVLPTTNFGGVSAVNPAGYFTGNGNTPIIGVSTGNTSGVIGSATNATTGGRGGNFSASNPDSDGVRAMNDAPSGTGAGSGLYGFTSQSGGVGVWAQNFHANGDGLYGFNAAATGAGIGSGIYGITSQSGGAGVWGFNDHAGGDGLYGINAAAAGTGVGSGVYGETAQGGGASATAGTWGVNTKSSGTAGTGVAGYAGSTSAAAINKAGVSGITNSAITGGMGVIGACDNATGVGVQGQSSGAGVSYAVLGTNSGANVGAVGIYGQITGAGSGTSFLQAAVRKDIHGAGNSVSGNYHFGIYGTGGLSTRSGGVMGHDYGTTFSAAGALGYYSSTPADIAVYGFGAAYTTGVAGGMIKQLSHDELFASKNGGIIKTKYSITNIDDDVDFNSWSVQKPNNMIGLGIYGGVMGGWIKGLVYGANLSGAKYGVYVHGKTITNDVIITLNSTENSINRIPTYAPSAMKIEVTQRGKGKLENGKATIQFDKNFAALISAEEPITITVTPLGSSKGIYIEKSDGVSFSVSENEFGKSNVEFNWIAVAVKKGFEKPNISPEIISGDFEIKMNGNEGIMYNDNNPADPLYSIWYDGKQVRFDKPPISVTDRRPTENNYYQKPLEKKSINRIKTPEVKSKESSLRDTK